MENQLSQNKYIEWIKRNRYVIFAFSLLLVLMGIVISLFVLSTDNPSTQTNTTISQPTAIPQRVEQQPTPTTTTKTISDEERASMINQTQAFIEQSSAVPVTVTAVKPYEGEWAIMQIENPQTDPGHVIVKKENGVWQVKLGPGTFFEEPQLRAVGAPQSLINEVNNLLLPR